MSFFRSYQSPREISSVCADNQPRGRVGPLSELKYASNPDCLTFLYFDFVPRDHGDISRVCVLWQS